MIDIILDVNIPKKVKNHLNGGRRIIHIGDIDTSMKDEDIIRLANKLNSIIVTHDKELAINASKKQHVLYIKRPVSAEDIIHCLEKNACLLKTASIFCENKISCKKCK